jgi:hypothetical protein
MQVRIFETQKKEDYQRAIEKVTRRQAARKKA